MTVDISAPVALTAGETKLLTSIMTRLNGANIDTNWDAVASDMGYKNSGIARTRWNQIRTKHFGTGAGKSSGSPSKSPGGKRKRADSDDGDTDGGAEPPTPTKRAKQGKAQAKVKAEEDEEYKSDVKKEEVDEDDD